MKFIWGFLLAVLLGAVAWFAFAFNWNYSTGERAGWVQKFSKKGWICKTWEGELAMVTMPGAIPEKFYFTVWDDATAEQINKLVGKRVQLHYDEKIGLPTSCFGETRHWVDKVSLVDDVQMVPGQMGLPAAAQPPAVLPAAPAPAPAAPPATK